MTVRRIAAFAATASVVATLALGVGTAGAATLNVCSTCTYTTIGAALAAAPAGARIVIAAGTYPEGPLNVLKNVTLQGAGAGATVITDGAPGSVLSIGQGLTVGIKGVTISGGSDPSSDGGTLCPFFPHVGGGICVLPTSRVTLTLTDVSGNSSPNLGGGIFDDGGTVTLTSSTVESNSAPDGGGIFSQGSTLGPNGVTITGSTVSGNTAGSDGGGIYNEPGSTLVVQKGSTVSSNNAGDDGGGILNNGIATVTGSTVSGNSAAAFGAGVFNNNGIGLPAVPSLTVSKSVFSNNAAGTDGGAIYNLGTLSLDTRTTFSGNTPDDCVGTGC
jgi:large repetitive protein